MAEIITENKPMKPMDYLSKRMDVYFVAGLLYAIPNACTFAMATDLLADNKLVATALLVIVTEIAMASQAYFYFRAVHRGTPVIGDIIRIYTEKSWQKNFYSLFIAMLAITAVQNIVCSVARQPPVVAMAVTAVTSLMIMMLKPVWYMFTANPHYPLKAYFVCSVKYMKGNLLKYMGIVLLYILAVFGGAMVAILRIAGSYGAAQLIFVAVWAVVLVYGLVLLDIRIALFMKNIIPEEWFSGQAQF